MSLLEWLDTLQYPLPNAYVGDFLRKKYGDKSTWRDALIAEGLPEAGISYVILASILYVPPDRLADEIRNRVWEKHEVSD